MNKGQQIVEMQKIICNCCGQFDGCSISCKAHKDLAETFYNAGYRKIDENCVVITKAELKEYKRQAVKVFAERLKKKVHSYYPSIDSYCMSRHVILIQDINELLKEYEE